MYFVADEGIISGDLPTRFTVSGSPIRNVVSIYDCYSVLHDLFNLYIVPKNPCLTHRQLKVMAIFFMDFTCIKSPFGQGYRLPPLVSYCGYSAGTIRAQICSYSMAILRHSRGNSRHISFFPYLLIYRLHDAVGSHPVAIGTT